MNVAFVYPDRDNLGVEYLSSSLKKADHNVILIFDPMLFESYYFKSRMLKKIFSYRKNIINNILKSKCNLLCFSVFSDYYGWACDIAEEIKKENKNLPIIFGGLHPSSIPEHCIEEPFIDYVCVGDGEEAIVELVNALEQGGDDSKIKNIWVKKNGRIIRNEPRPLTSNLDILPFPDKEIFRNEYGNFMKEAYSIITGRGCVNACTYCYNSYLKNLYGENSCYLRRRSVDNVIEELVQAKEKYGIKRVAFFDDIFIYDTNWLDKFASRYRKIIGLPYFCNVHPSYINEQTVALLKLSGCSTVTMGIQTFDENIRRKMLDRPESNSQVIQAIELLKKAKIFLYTDIIFGLPFQDESVMVNEVKFTNEFRVDIPVTNWLRYYPKTKIVQIARDHSLLSEDDIRNIEKNKKYLPYSGKGSTYNKRGAKLRNMLILSHLLPKKIVNYILDQKLYRFLPAWDMRFYIEIIIIEYKKIFLRRKLPFAYFSILDMVKYHLYYIQKKCRFH